MEEKESVFKKEYLKKLRETLLSIFQVVLILPKDVDEKTYITKINTLNEQEKNLIYKILENVDWYELDFARKGLIEYFRDGNDIYFKDNCMERVCIMKYLLRLNLMVVWSRNFPEDSFENLIK